MNFCTKCGGQNPANSAVCAFCANPMSVQPGNNNPNVQSDIHNPVGQQPFNSGMPPHHGDFVPQPTQQNQTNTMGIVSLILGIVALVTGCVFSPMGGIGLASIILAAIGMKKPSGKGMCLAGLIMGIVALFIAVFGSIVFFSMGVYQDMFGF